MQRKSNVLGFRETLRSTSNVGGAPSVWCRKSCFTFVTSFRFRLDEVHDKTVRNVRWLLVVFALSNESGRSPLGVRRCIGIVRSLAIEHGECMVYGSSSELMAESGRWVKEQ